MNLRTPGRPSIARGLALALAGTFASTMAHASFLSGDALDTAANVLSWVVLVIVPIVGIVVFWLVHILPEKIAEQKRHPQAKAIQTLCLLSLVFGGLLWPLAWLWAYTKPVLHQLAYGTDVHEHPAEEAGAAQDAAALDAQITKVREQLAALEAQAQEARG